MLGIFHSSYKHLHGYYSTDNVKFPDGSLTVRGTPPQHSACWVLLISCTYQY